MKDIQIRESQFVIFDLETTGLYADQGDKMIEIGAVRVKNLEIEDEEFQSLVNPERSIPAASSAVHGITDKDVEKSPKADKILPKFFEFVGNRIWVAQNAAFDLSFVMRDAKRLGIPFSDRIVLDTMKVSKILFPNAGSHSLDAMMARLEIAKTGDRHRSLDDCRYTARALIEMIKLLEKQGVTKITELTDAFIKTEGIIKTAKPKPMGLFGGA